MSEQSADDSAPGANALVLRAASQPTNPLAWGFIGFMTVFGIGAGTDFLLHGEQTLQSTFALPVAVLAGIAVAAWPRPLFLKELRVSSQGISGSTRDGSPFQLPFETVECISAEGLFDLGRQTYERWGRLHIRAGKRWLAIQVSPVGIKPSFNRMLELLPHTLGISGDQQITVPAIADINKAAEWISRLDRMCRRELGRQVRYLILYGTLSTAAGLCAVGYALLASQLPPLASRHSFLLVAILLLAAGGAFLAAAWKRWIFLMRIRTQIAAIRPG